MSESITHNQKLDKDCAKSIVEQLESLNIAPSEIARRCGVKQSRINGWKDGQKPSDEYLQKLRALLNLRLPNHKAETFQVSKCVRLALSKEDLDLFLVKQVKAFIGGLESLPFELREKFDSTVSLESLNEVIATQYHLYVCKEVDSDLHFSKKQEHLLSQMSPYVKPFSVLPSSYQNTMQAVLAQLKKAIQEAEEQIESKTHREKNQREFFKSTIEYSISSSLQRTLYNRNPDQNLEEIKDELLQQVDKALQDFNYTGTYFTHPLAELVSIMTRVAQFLDDSQFGPKYGMLRLENRDAYFSDSISKPDGFIEFDDIEFAIDSAKKLQGTFEKFIEEQQDRYSELFNFKEKELGLCSKLDSDKVFHQKACEALTSGKELEVLDPRLNDLSVIADSILKSGQLKIALDGNKHELELLNGLKDMLTAQTPEPVIHTVQIGGKLAFSTERESQGKTLIYSLDNNDLILLQEASIFDQKILTIQPKLAAEELLDHIDVNLKESVKQSLLEHGYMFSDVEVFG
ncbi:helix-turn-helix transcriptional regulator [Vibrio sp. SM6]|uniref:Helix-turn-helix transcriptional regulator n=1 Tax=Vibrio agarilyticus TaxID=2726741 RepID=A0A7X8YHH8_9VIBR|nr:helix-turn-helix transcriptional regulator [Vibrio agarilyticus]NLS13600.1 helix-turn-helix transcriptional regulator [Vibrio agarilyticus]